MKESKMEYNQEKLAEAIKAFGEERLEEYYKRFPEGRLMEGSAPITESGRYRFAIYDFTESTQEQLAYIYPNGNLGYGTKSLFTYLEPPRPLRKEGHTKEDMEEAWSTGWDNQLRLQSEGSFETFEDWYFDKFPTATAPTEEHIDTSAIEFPSDDSLLATGQPEPSFTREEMLAKVPKLEDCVKMFHSISGTEHKIVLKKEEGVFYTIEDGSSELITVDSSYLSVPKPLPTRLDLLIKWWGEQERPSEIEFKVDTFNGFECTSTYPRANHTHYRRGTSEWISLEGIIDG
jgi:hypothetical protein